MTRTIVVVNGHIEEHSTRAAIDFVRTVRLQLDLQVRRHGPGAVNGREHRRLARSITPDALRETWPEADVERVLAAASPAVPGVDAETVRAVAGTVT